MTGRNGCAILKMRITNSYYFKKGVNVMEIIGTEEVMQLLGVSRKEALRILNLPGCPILPRTKWQHFRVVKDPFLEWISNGASWESLRS